MKYVGKIIKVEGLSQEVNNQVASIKWSFLKKTPKLVGPTVEIEITGKTVNIYTDGIMRFGWPETLISVEKYIGDYPHKKSIYVGGEEKEFAPKVVLVIKTTCGHIHLVPNLF